MLVAGGQADRHGAPLASAAIYDPGIRTWTPTGSMATARYAHTATLLPNGEVLVAGGVPASGEYLSSAELFDPTTGTWHATAPMHSGHAVHSATLLESGKVLVAGGSPDAAELYDPKTGSWSLTGRLPLVLDEATSTLLADGNVLLAGGNGYDPDGVLARTEIYDAGAGTWTYGHDLHVKREYHEATTLLDTKVLITGGFDPAVGALNSAELSDPSDGSWVLLDPMRAARLGQTATLLPNGLVLVAGGQLGPGQASLASAELYDSGKYPGPSWVDAAPMTAQRDQPYCDAPRGRRRPRRRRLWLGGLGRIGETYRAAPRALPKSGRMDDGTYLTPFEPAFSLTRSNPRRGRCGAALVLGHRVRIRRPRGPRWRHLGGRHQRSPDRPGHRSGQWRARVTTGRPHRMDRAACPAHGRRWPNPDDDRRPPRHPFRAACRKQGRDDRAIAGITDFGAGFGAGQHRVFYVLDVESHKVVIAIGLIDLEDLAKLGRAVGAPRADRSLDYLGLTWLERSTQGLGTHSASGRTSAIRSTTPGSSASAAATAVSIAVRQRTPSARPRAGSPPHRGWGRSAASGVLTTSRTAPV